MEALNVTDFCKIQKISRSTFYEHKRNGVFKGCFAQNGKLIPERADAALSKVDRNEGAEATRQKWRGSGIEGFTPAQAVYLQHAIVSGFFSLKFDKPNTGGHVTKDDLQTSFDENISLALECLKKVARNDQPLKSALGAAVFILTALRPAGFNLDTERIEELRSMINIATFEELSAQAGGDK